MIKTFAGKRTVALLVDAPVKGVEEAGR